MAPFHCLERLPMFERKMREKNVDDREGYKKEGHWRGK